MEVLHADKRCQAIVDRVGLSYHSDRLACEFGEVDQMDEVQALTLHLPELVREAG